MYSRFTVYDNELGLLADFVDKSENISEHLKTIFSGTLTLAPVESLNFTAIFSGSICVGRVYNTDVKFYLYNDTTNRYFREVAGFPSWDIRYWRDAKGWYDKEILDKVASTLNDFTEDTYIVEVH